MGKPQARQVKQKAITAAGREIATELTTAAIGEITTQASALSGSVLAPEHAAYVEAYLSGVPRMEAYARAYGFVMEGQADRDRASKGSARLMRMPAIVGAIQAGQARKQGEITQSANHLRSAVIAGLYALGTQARDERTRLAALAELGKLNVVGLRTKEKPADQTDNMDISSMRLELANQLKQLGLGDLVSGTQSARSPALPAVREHAPAPAPAHATPPTPTPTPGAAPGSPEAACDSPHPPTIYSGDPEHTGSHPPHGAPPAADLGPPATGGSHTADGSPIPQDDTVI